MITKIDKNQDRLKRHSRVRKKVSGTAACPRLSVYRSLNHIYAQIIDDEAKNTLVAASTMEKEIAKEIEGKTYKVSKGVISLQNDRGTSYQAYIAVQNELVKAVNELRDEFSRANFGKKFSKLTEEEQDIVKKAVPQNISEAEPKDTGKKK